MNICIVGAGGSIGSRLTKYLIDKNCNVTAVVRSISSAVRIGRYPIKIVRLDISTAEQSEINDVFKGMDLVIDASFSKETDYAKRVEQSTIMANRISRAVLDTHVKKLIHYGTISVYPKGNSEISEQTVCKQQNDSYADSKLAAENELLRLNKTENLPVLILQLPVVYGPFMLWSIAPVASMKQGCLVMPDQLDGECSPIHVDDVCEATWAAINKDTPTGERILLPSNNPISWVKYYQSYHALSDDLQLKLLAKTEVASVNNLKKKNQKPFVKLKNSFKHDSKFRQLVLAQIGFRNIYSMIRKHKGPQGINKLKSIMITPENEQLSENYLNSQMIETMDTMPKIKSTKANDLLGFTPAISFEDGLKTTKPWLQWYRLI